MDCIFHRMNINGLDYRKNGLDQKN